MQQKNIKCFWLNLSEFVSMMRFTLAKTSFRSWITLEHFWHSLVFNILTISQMTDWKEDKEGFD